MSAIELKNEIHKKIDTIDSLEELLDLNISLGWFMPDQLSYEEKKIIQRLQQVPNDSKTNRGIAQKVVMENARKWLRK